MTIVKAIKQKPEMHIFPDGIIVSNNANNISYKGPYFMNKNLLSFIDKNIYTLWIVTSTLHIHTYTNSKQLQFSFH